MSPSRGQISLSQTPWEGGPDDMWTISMRVGNTNALHKVKTMLFNLIIITLYRATCIKNLTTSDTNAMEYFKCPTLT